MPIGAHVSTSGGLSRAVQRAEALGAECMQIFLAPPQRWGPANHRDDEVQAFVRQMLAARIGPNFAHARYLINLASAEPKVRQRSMNALAACAEWAQRCRLDGVVLHVGSALGQPTDEAERQVASSLREVLDRSGSARILLENSAGSGHTLGARFKQIGALLDRLERDPRLEVCLDTAHAFASGYDLRTDDGLAQMLAEIKRHVSVDRLRLVHANDSRAALGSAVDRHENIGLGLLGEQSFRRMLAHP